jgi:surface protein
MDQSKRQRRDSSVLVQTTKWHSLPEELLLTIVSHFDIKTLMRKKQVCCAWRQACTDAASAKHITSTTQKVFTTRKELFQAVEKYCYCCSKNPDQAEEIAQTYGWPMNQWNVSNVSDFSTIFQGLPTFNEDISSWDVSHSTNMQAMFYGALVFNQDISKWDMHQMFEDAIAFDQNLAKWNVSRVRNMTGMFQGASSFNQNLSCWNVSQVNSMRNMFRNATSFDQDIDSWEYWDSSKL